MMQQLIQLIKDKNNTKAIEIINSNRDLLAQKDDTWRDMQIKDVGPLMASVYYKNMDMANWLIENGADCDESANECDPTSRSKTTVLETLIIDNEDDVAARLLKKCKIKKPLYKDVPRRLMDMNKIGLLKEFLSASGKINQLDRVGESLLHVSVFDKKIDVLQMLIALKADVNVVNRHGKHTPLWLACMYGRKEYVDALIDAGADPKICDSNNENMLHASVRADLEFVVYMSSKYPEMKRQKSLAGQLPYELASEFHKMHQRYEYFEIAACLKDGV